MIGFRERLSLAGGYILRLCEAGGKSAAVAISTGFNFKNAGI